MGKPVAREGVVDNLKEGAVNRLIVKARGSHCAIAWIGLVSKVRPQSVREAKPDAHRVDREPEAQRRGLPIEFEVELLVEGSAIPEANARITPERHPADLDRTQRFMRIEADVLD